MAKAASGNRLPSWEVTRAYVQACGGDLKEWRARWEDVAQQQATVAGSQLPWEPSAVAESAPVAVTTMHRARTVPVPAQLAQDVPGFTRRAAELTQLLSLLLPEETQEGEAAVVISAISGPAGIGKSALAVRFAHQVAHLFPDGQFYVNLRGFGPSCDPIGPGEVLHGFLCALGMAPDLIPAELQAQAALFRSLLANKAMLLLLDNARDAEQVRPLLPAGPGCLVIVTSRSQLPGLIARDGARPLILDVLTQDESIALLAARIGRQRIDAEFPAAADLASLCGGLPLALVIVAARVALHPRLPLTAIVGELRQAGSILDYLATGDAATDLRAVFSWSYEQLPESAARMFRLLGLHPGPDISALAAASLAAIPSADAQAVLRKLTVASLVNEQVPGRFTCHDLFRAYAGDLANAPGSPDDPRKALARLFDYYLSTAATAMDLLYPVEWHHQPHFIPSVIPPSSLDSPKAALAWLDAECPCLVAVAAHAATHGWRQHASLLSAVVERISKAGITTKV